MKEDIRQFSVGPACAETYTEPPALSRTDNEKGEEEIEV